MKGARMAPPAAARAFETAVDYNTAVATNK
jgi:hypothetical protein